MVLCQRTGHPYSIVDLSVTYHDMVFRPVMSAMIKRNANDKIETIMMNYVQRIFYSDVLSNECSGDYSGSMILESLQPINTRLADPVKQRATVVQAKRSNKIIDNRLARVSADVSSYPAQISKVVVTPH